MDTIPEWLSELPSELHESKVLTMVPDVATLAKNYVEQDKVVNGSIRLPKESDPASKEKFTERLDSMGYAPKQEVPETYELNGVGDDEWQQKWLEGRQNYYKEAGLTQAQAEKALGLDKQEVDAYAESIKQTTTALQEKYGESLKGLAEGAKKAIEKYGLEAIDKSPFGANLEWNELMIELGKEFSEDTNVEPGTMPTGETKAELDLEEKALMAEMSQLSRDGKLTEGHPEAALFNAKMEKFRAKKYGLKPGQSLSQLFDTVEGGRT